MGNVVVLLVLALMIGYVAFVVRGRRRNLVARRGTGVGADLGGLSDARRVRVTLVNRTGPERVRIVLSPEAGGGDGDGGGEADAGATEMDLQVSLREDDFGVQLLEQWRDESSPLAIVIPPNSHLIRLRSVDSLQHLLLRRTDD